MPGGQRVDDDGLLGARHLRHAELRVIGALAQELGIDRHEGLACHPRASLRELLGRRDRLHEG